MKRGLLAILALVLVLAYSFSAQSKAHKEIEELFGDEEEVEVIVVLKDDYGVLNEYGTYSNKDDFEAKKMMINGQQEDVLKDLKLKKKDKGMSAQSNEDYDFDLTNTYTTVNGFAGKLKKSAYKKLKDNPKVLRIEKSLPVKAVLDTSKEQVNASNTWRLIYNNLNITGKGESVCIIDSGVDYTHPSLGGCTSDSFTAGTCPKIIAGNNYCPTDDCNSQNSTPFDNNGHGTHVVGIVASTNNTYRGISPDATIVAIKALDSTGSGTTANIVAGIDWCVNNASKYNISVISMSLGTSLLFTSNCDSSSTSFTDAVANSIKKNISVIAATGNDGSTSGIALPACIANVTSVGSVGDTDEIASYSNRNSITDLLAPGGANTVGNHIKSTVPKGSCELCDSSGFKELSGTSMATPHVAAAFALLRQYRRLERGTTLTPAQIQDTLNDTGKQISDSGSGLTFSRINIYSALISLDIVTPDINFVSPTPTNNSNFYVNSTETYIFVNVSSNEILANATLEWNGTNETMRGSGLSWFKNKTNLSSVIGNISFKVWGNDSSGNMGVSLTREITVYDLTVPNITFVAPTPANGTNLSLNSTDFFVYINISATEMLSSAILEINNGTKTNISMTINGLNSFVNLTSLKVGVISFRVYGNDSAGNSNITELRTFQINNTAPNISSFAPDGEFINISELDNQTFSINFSDSENDAVTFNWYLNNSLHLNGISKNEFNFTGNFTAAGIYIINVTLDDGIEVSYRSWNLTVNNTNIAITISSFSPNQTSLEIAEPNNQTFNITYSNIDGDSVSITWYQNSALKATSINFTFVGNSTAAGFYNITAIVSDETNTTSQSWNLSVYNPAPNITSTPVTSGIEGVVYQYSVVAVDPDSDDLIFTDNTSLFDINSLTGLISFIPNTAGGYTINITVSDEINKTSQIYNLSIEKENTNSTISSPFTNDSVISGDSVVIKLTTSNFANCSYSMDNGPFKEFSDSTADYWKVGIPINKFELSEQLTGTAVDNRETLRNITTFIDKDDLIGLASGSVTNSKNTSPYKQYLYILGQGSGNQDTGYVEYTENDEDTTADFLYFKSGREIGRYVLLFEPTPFESGIYDNNSNPSQLGLNLKDFKNVTIKIFGKEYKVIEAKRTSPNGNGIRLIFANKTADALVKTTFFVEDTLLEKQTKSYTIKDKNYSITLNFVDSDEAQFVVNNKATGKLKINWKQDLTENLVLEVNDILYQDYAGGVHGATFSISAEEITTAQKFELRDDNVEDSISTNALKVNDNTIDDAFVIIEGSDDNIAFKINRIHVNMTADDNFFVAAGARLTNAIEEVGGSLAEPEVLFTQNWNIAYKGLSNESIEIVQLKTSGTSQYNLEFVDGDGNKVSIPIAKTPTGSSLRFGELDGSRAFINKENKTINKDDYFILSDSNSSRKRGERLTYALQYKGADKVTTDNPVLKFKNLGSGVTIEKSYTNKTTSIIGPEGSILTELVALNFSDSNFTVYAVGDINNNDFGIVIDIDANGLIVSNPTSSLTSPLPITTKNGMEINITNETGNPGEDTSDIIFVTFRIPDDKRDGFARDSVETLLPTVMKWNITASSGEVRLAQDTTTEEKRINLRTPGGKLNIAYGYDSYGNFYTYETPTSAPQSLTIEVPAKQRLPLVYYENGGLHSQLLQNITKGSHNITINCSNIFGEITDYHFSFNIATTPNITSYLPANESTNISIKSDITINFSENIDKSTIGQSSIVIQDTKGEKIKWTYLYNDTINQTVIDPIHFLKDNTTYTVNVTARIKSVFGRNLDKDYVWRFTTAKKDIDNDGVPDEEDSDIDNDGIDDIVDFLKGNLSNVNSNFLNLSLTIDSDENIPKSFNGTKKLEFRIKDKKLLEFDFNFSNSSILDLSNLSILNASNSSLGGVLIRGISLSKFDFKKIAYVERVDNNKNGICVKDEEIDWIDNISNNCDGQNEFKVECDGSTQNGYACAHNSSSNLYRVTGISHSGIIQLSYTQSSGSSSGGGGGSSGGGSGGGGGGGGSGGGAFFVCNMDWECGEWSDCVNGLQTRQCEFVKVPQHAQDAQCPSQSSPPAISQKCEISKQAQTATNKTIVAKSDTSQSIQNVTQITQKETSQITGFAVKDLMERMPANAYIAVIALIAAVAVFFGFRFYRHKKK